MSNLFQTGALGIVLGAVIVAWLGWKCAEPFLIERNVRRGVLDAPAATRHLFLTAIILLAPLAGAVLILRLLQRREPLVWYLGAGLIVAGGLTLWKAFAIRGWARTAAGVGKGAPPGATTPGPAGSGERAAGDTASGRPGPGDR